ncbi:hypothetical protein [Janthinobacterium sp. FW305-128]|uniref:hypothetical protein n=1 Tax=Janthinobacterium sp. FW305-128 TaxID=2775055 RepID=UPI001E375CFF|nr:hypothetical protein [Janthinobacterium sp. FW305-128]MCC7682694.1 hypothetical protein [Janthinobacterium sp. FW305-128]
MTAFLSKIYSIEKIDPSDHDRFFDGIGEMKEIVKSAKARECPDPGFPPHAMRICFSVSSSTAPTII